MKRAFLGVMLCGCPWISAEEHADNLERLEQADDPTTGTGTPVTSTPGTSSTTTETTPSTTTPTTDPTTTSTTSPTSTTSSPPTTPTKTTPWVCESDEFEPNHDIDDPAKFSEEDLPVEALATLCWEDSQLYPDLDSGIRYDWFATALDTPEQVLLVQVRDGVEHTCETLDMNLLTFRPNGTVLFANDPPGVCPLLRYGHGVTHAAFPYDSFLAYTYESAPDMDYTLSIETIACPDSDGDGALDMACGGFDCQPLDPEIHPAAFEVPGSGVDENCDGVFEALECEGGAPSLTPVQDAVPCMAPRLWETAYDVFRFDVNEGSCVEIRTDTLFEYGPELLIEVEGANGQLRASSNMNWVDTELCSHPSWSGSSYSCPVVRFVAEATGTVLVAVGQWSSGFEPSLFPKSGACPVVGEYELSVTLDGFLSVPPILVYDDRIRTLGESPF